MNLNEFQKIEKIDNINANIIAKNINTMSDQQIKEKLNKLSINLWCNSYGSMTIDDDEKIEYFEAIQALLKKYEYMVEHAKELREML